MRSSWSSPHFCLLDTSQICMWWIYRKSPFSPATWPAYHISSWPCCLYQTYFSFEKRRHCCCSSRPACHTCNHVTQNGVCHTETYLSHQKWCFNMFVTLKPICHIHDGFYHIKTYLSHLKCCFSQWDLLFAPRWCFNCEIYLTYPILCFDVETHFSHWNRFITSALVMVFITRKPTCHTRNAVCQPETYHNQLMYRLAFIFTKFTTRTLTFKREHLWDYCD